MEPIKGKYQVIDTNARFNVADDTITDFRDHCYDMDWKLDKDDNEVAYKDNGKKYTIDDYLQMCYETDLDDFYFNLKHAKTVKCVVTGNLGLWWGRPSIKPTFFDDIYDAVMTCIGSDTLEFDALVDGNVMYFNAYHHDGCNSFEIYLLNDETYDKLYDDDNLTDNEIADIIKKEALNFCYEHLGR